MDDFNNNSSIIMFHTDALKDKNQKNYIDNSNSIKICVGRKKDFIDKCDASLELPASLKDINSIVENTAAKKI